MKPFLAKLLIALSLSFAAGATVVADREMAKVKDIEIVEKTDVRFPGTMRAIGVREGTVSLVVSVDANGEIQDTFILESTRNAFTKSALKSLSEWTFSPATYNDAPIASSLRIDLNFQVDRRLAWQTIQAPGPADVTRSSTEERPVTKAQFEELDSIPLPIEMTEPTAKVDGIATVEFYIDELGHVRCPRIVAGSSLAFGRSLLDTVSKWKFEPPLAAGNRTNTMVRQTLSLRNGTFASADTH
ncbi:TonB family protein [Pelagicoccus sp. NFK12]|uniref:TonB family protein n=1 Tax=Pelagicoccus enzymogenes TaxID=2773457 RepID=A0A927F528_9BACT|nr:TonB family protein [Pelagicoccus enzymogenes]MBD5778312.1 TonB family protein [Pelagicoccus enzymogenes]